MPKAKRRKNIFGFGRKSSGNYIPASGGIAKHAPKHRAKAKGGASDSKYDDVAKSLAGKPYSRLTSSQQATVRGIASKMNPRRKRKRNLEVGLPKNQFVNAKVRVKGGKVQILADQSVLGKAGFKGSAGLSGVSVSGGAKLNPRALGKRLTGYPVKRKLKRSIESHPGITKREETYLHRQAERLRKRFVGPRGRLPNPHVTLSGRNDSTDRSVYSGDERIGTVRKSSKTGEWQAKDRSGRNHGWYTSDWNAAKQLALALGK